MIERPKQIPITISKIIAQQKLRRVNEAIVLAYESGLKNKERDKIINRLYKRKREMLAILESQ